MQETPQFPTSRTKHWGEENDRRKRGIEGWCRLLRRGQDPFHHYSNCGGRLTCSGQYGRVCAVLPDTLHPEKQDLRSISGSLCVSSVTEQLHAQPQSPQRRISKLLDHFREEAHPQQTSSACTVLWHGLTDCMDCGSGNGLNTGHGHRDQSGAGWRQSFGHSSDNPSQLALGGIHPHHRTYCRGAHNAGVNGRRWVFRQLIAH